MPQILDVTDELVKTLPDNLLRNLIGRLCEAEYRACNLNVNSIYWSGHQDASDGGVDVMVDSKIQPPETCFLPNACTAFQVKVSDLSRSEIFGEMKPDGELLPAIENLDGKKGSYIIVSANSKSTNKTLANRLNAMRDCVAGLENSVKLTTPFQFKLTTCSG